MPGRQPRKGQKKGTERYDQKDRNKQGKDDVPESKRKECFKTSTANFVKGC